MRAELSDARNAIKNKYMMINDPFTAHSDTTR
jgi:hypothetical protein